MIEELAAGREAGVDLPDPTQFDWVRVRRPVSAAALPLIRDLGPGETEVLMLGLESRESILVLDDALARRVAVGLGLRLSGLPGQNEGGLLHLSFLTTAYCLLTSETLTSAY